MNVKVIRQVLVWVSAIVVAVTLLDFATLTGEDWWAVAPFAIFSYLGYLSSYKKKDYKVGILAIAVIMFLVNVIDANPSFVDVAIWAAIFGAWASKDK